MARPAQDGRDRMPSPPSIWTVLVALLGTHLAGMGAFVAVPVLAPAIAADSGIPAAYAGVHTALAYLGSLVSGPVTGAYLRRFGGIRVLQAGLLVVALAIALAALGTAWAPALSAFLGGLGHGPVTPAGSHILAARTPARRRGLIFSLKQTGVPLGAMLIAAIAPLITLAAGWRVAVLAIAAFVVLFVVSLQPLRAALDADRDRGLRDLGFGAAGRAAVASLGLLRAQAALRRLTLMSALYGVSQFCFLSFFVVFQVEALGVPLAEAGFRLACGQAAGAAGRVLWGVLADRTGEAGRVMAGVGLGAAGAGLAFAMTEPDWPGLLILFLAIVMGGTASGWNGIFLAETARMAPPGQVGAATAAGGFVFGVTMLVAPPAFSAMVGLTGGYEAGFLFCAAAALLGATLAARLPRRG